MVPTAHKPVKRRGKPKLIRPDERGWFFTRLLDGWRVKYKTRCLAVMEAKTGKLLGSTAEFKVGPPAQAPT